jgi:hypothetical protein
MIRDVHPGSVFCSILDPGSRGHKSTGSQIHPGSAIFVNSIVADLIHRSGHFGSVLKNTTCACTGYSTGSRAARWRTLPRSGCRLRSCLVSWSPALQVPLKIDQILPKNAYSKTKIVTARISSAEYRTYLYS